MRHSLKILSCLTFSVVAFLGVAQTTNIPDPVFEQLLIEAGLDNYPLNGYVATASIDTVTILDLYTSSSSMNVTDLTGIEAFESLTYLMVNYAELTALNLSQNFALQEVHTFGNEITDVVLPASGNLTFLDVSSNPLVELDVSQNPGLTSLACYYTELNELDVTSNAALTSLSCSFNNLSELDLSHNPNLEVLYCAMNSLSELDVSQSLNLENLNCSFNDLQELNVSGLTSLKKLHCNENELSILDIGNNVILDFLDCSANQITELNASNHPLMTELFCQYNALNTLVVSAGLIGLDCDHNQLESLDISMVETLVYSFNCSFNPLTCIQVSASQLNEPIAGWVVDADDFISIDCDYTGMWEESFQMDGEEEIQVYFRSTTQGLNIISSAPYNRAMQAELYGLNGQLVFQSSSLSSEIVIPWSNWPSECAIVRVQTGSNLHSRAVCFGEYR